MGSSSRIISTLQELQKKDKEMENLFEERKEIGIKFKKLKKDFNQDYSKRTM